MPSIVEYPSQFQSIIRADTATQFPSLETASPSTSISTRHPHGLFARLPMIIPDMTTRLQAVAEEHFHQRLQSFLRWPRYNVSVLACKTARLEDLPISDYCAVKKQRCSTIHGSNPVEKKNLRGENKSPVFLLIFLFA